MSGSTSKFRAFVKRNLVMIVMLPSLGALHLVWHYIQNQDVFVSKEDRLDGMPIVLAAKRYYGVFEKWREEPGKEDGKDKT